MKAIGTSETIQHEGTVQKVSSDSVVVNISSVSACAGCHAESYCSLSDKKDKTILIAGSYNVEQGETVTVLMNESTGFRAVILSYIIPLFILLFAVVILTSLSVNELTAGLISIAVLVPYFLILYFVRNRIDRSFIFTLKK
ncbi:MAG: SoxR reducing system RseC family protein [Bacteroidales bacterium]|nr:SoxR reducing system RseC family protein [Bacteroidales bacterium]